MRRGASKRSSSASTTMLCVAWEAGFHLDFGLCNVEDKEQQREAKEAVDFIASSLSPDFIAILDGPDVIPHITLDNPNALMIFFRQSSLAICLMHPARAIRPKCQTS